MIILLMEIQKKVLRYCLARPFEIKVLVKLNCFLRIEAAYSKQGLFVSQGKYTLDLLKETGKLGTIKNCPYLAEPQTRQRRNECCG